jgi:periplasmic divalent cation tolerance protein
VLEILLVYAPCPELAVARSLGKTLIEERLAACINILGPTLTLYKEECLVETQEYILIAKAALMREEALKQRLLGLHPYNTPAIFSWKVKTHEHFFNWVMQTLTQGEDIPHC